jgi:uncharacterized protein (TIGR02145 family)
MSYREKGGDTHDDKPVSVRLPRQARWGVALSAALLVGLTLSGKARSDAHVAGPAMGVACPDQTTVQDAEGNVYSTVRIGSQCWMREDLRATKFSGQQPIPTAANNAAWSASANRPRRALRRAAGGALLHLYNFSAVQDERGICPAGWKVPSHEQWMALREQVGTADAGRRLKSTQLKTAGIFGWDSPNVADNTSGFSGLPAGYRSGSGVYASMHKFGYWWSDTPSGPDKAGFVAARNSSSTLKVGSFDRRAGFSVRCVRVAPVVDPVVDPAPASCPIVVTEAVEQVGSDQATVRSSVGADGNDPVIARGVAWDTAPDPTLAANATGSGSGSGVFTVQLGALPPTTTFFVRAYATNSVRTCYGETLSFTTLPAVAQETQNCPTTVSDISGNVYGTVRIGSQCWMKQNLKTLQYRDGSPVVGFSLAANNAGYFPVTNFYPGVYRAEFGELYNHRAVTEAKGLCPVGWHVPSNEEWNTLASFLDPAAAPNAGAVAQTLSATAGGALKSLKTYDPQVSASFFGWTSPNTQATDAVGFDGRPAGQRRDHLFDVLEMRKFGGWWASTSTGDAAWYHAIRFDNGAIVRASDSRTRLGLSVRCVKD